MTGSRPSARRARAPGVRLDASGLWLGERSTALCAGVMHYFALDPSAWPKALGAARELGVTAVELPVPWAVHEVDERRYDFGDDDPRRHLGRFLALAHEAGLHVLLRPGPFVDAELDRSGLPERVVGDARFTACDRDGRPVLSLAPPRMFAVPSLASRAFREQTAHWLAAVVDVVAPYAWPDGPVVSLELDAAAPLFAPDAPWNADHHPDALALHRGSERPHLDARDEAGRDALSDWMSVVRRGPLERLALSTRAPGRDAGGAGPRVELGAPPWRAPRTDAEGASAVRAAWARGDRRLRLHALVDTGRWIGAPIDAYGRLRAGAEPLGRLLHELQAAPWSPPTRAPSAQNVSIPPGSLAAGGDRDGRRPIRSFSMLSAALRVDGFDASSWHNLVGLFDRRPARDATPAAPEPRGLLLALTDAHGSPHTTFFTGGDAPDAAALGTLDDLAGVAARHRASRVLVATEDDFESLVAESRARVPHDADYVTQCLDALSALAEWDRAGRVRSWPRLGRVSPWTSAAAARALDLALPVGASALLCAWQDGRMWTAAAVRRGPDGVDRLIGPELVLDWAGPLSGDPQRDHRLLSRGVGRALAPVHVGLFGERALLADLLRGAKPGAWASAVATRDVVLQPMPPSASVLVTADTLRAAAAWAERRAEQIDVEALVGPLARGWQARLTELAGAARFDPLLALWKRWQAPSKDDLGNS